MFPSLQKRRSFLHFAKDKISGSIFLNTAVAVLCGIGKSCPILTYILSNLSSGDHDLTGLKQGKLPKQQSSGRHMLKQFEQSQTAANRLMTLWV